MHKAPRPGRAEALAGAEDLSNRLRARTKGQDGHSGTAPEMAADRVRRPEVRSTLAPRWHSNDAPPRRASRGSKTRLRNVRLAVTRMSSDGRMKAHSSTQAVPNVASLPERRARRVRAWPRGAENAQRCTALHFLRARHPAASRICSQSTAAPIATQTPELQSCGRKKTLHEGKRYV